jgi:hypothetical protein
MQTTFFYHVFIFICSLFFAFPAFILPFILLMLRVIIGAQNSTTQKDKQKYPALSGIQITFPVSKQLRPRGHSLSSAPTAGRGVWWLGITCNGGFPAYNAVRTVSLDRHLNRAVVVHVDGRDYVSELRPLTGRPTSRSSGQHSSVALQTSQVKISAQRPAILTEVFRGFP